ncbi:MAG: hypothetical protein GWP15_00405 [Nitrospirae bacterium]|nr:hypothetical protein [Nitrospirota bacterium]
MFKKVFTGVIVTAILAIMLPALSATAAISGYTTDIDVLVDGSSVTTFRPANGEIATISFDLLQSATVTLQITDTSNVIEATIVNGAALTAGTKTYTWYGTVDNINGGTILDDGDYHVKLYVEDGGFTYFDYVTITIDTITPLTLTSYTVAASGGGDLDPSPLGDNEDLNISYTLNQDADSVTATVKDSDQNTLKTFTASNSASGTFVWDGQYAGRLVDPGIYTVDFSASKSSHTDVTSTASATVSYDNSNKPGISGLSVSPTSFDPDFEDTEITFTNTKDADLLVEIYDDTDTEVRDFSDYNHTNYLANESHTIVWNGEDNSSNEVGVGTYTVHVRAENDYGVVIETTSVSVDDDLGDLTESNSHIGAISLSPSSTFEPAEDDELEIEFDVKTDLDELRIVAILGSQEVEIYDESNVDEEDDVQVFWDGTDNDDEYVDQGTWRIIFYSEVGSTALQASKSIDVEYEKPEIDDLYLSKDEFDNDLSEFTYILFRVDSDALVDIFVLEGGNEDDDIAEDMAVEGNKWYAVEWDGGGYDYDDDLEIKVVAKNKVNEDIYDTEKIDVELDEDDVSSSKSNVTKDFLSPVLSDGSEYLSLFYDLEEDADVVITIHKGTSTSGTKVIELVDLDDQDSGAHEILWDGTDDDGDELRNGVYTYKIVSRLSSSETESGHFVIGSVGDIDGGATTSSSSSGIGANVIVDGFGGNTGDYCAGYTDVYTSSSYCDAIAWTTSEGIFLGYSDNTFQPYDDINRVEFLKVLLEAYNATILPDDGTNLGFIDVNVGAWYMPYIRTGKTLGIFHGDVGYYTARPADTVNRAEALKMIFETLDAMAGYNMGICNTNYNDVPYYAWYASYACESYKYQLFNGEYLYPSNPTTRGEAAELLYKLHNAGAI